VCGRPSIWTDDYRITILSDKSLQIDGRPHTLDEEATHYGLEMQWRRKRAQAIKSGIDRTLGRIELANVNLVNRRVLIDEPPEMTQRRKLEEKGTPDIRPTSGGQLAAVSRVE
jgi:asparagine synthetase B (glutamine-hydrolysing)